MWDNIFLRRKSDLLFCQTLSGHVKCEDVQVVKFAGDYKLGHLDYTDLSVRFLIKTNLQTHYHCIISFPLLDYLQCFCSTTWHDEFTYSVNEVFRGMYPETDTLPPALLTLETRRKRSHAFQNALSLHVGWETLPFKIIFLHICVDGTLKVLALQKQNKTKH